MAEAPMERPPPPKLAIDADDVPVKPPPRRMSVDEGDMQPGGAPPPHNHNPLEDGLAALNGKKKKKKKKGASHDLHEFDSDVPASRPPGIPPPPPGAPPPGSVVHPNAHLRPRPKDPAKAIPLRRPPPPTGSEPHDRAYYTRRIMEYYAVEKPELSSPEAVESVIKTFEGNKVPYDKMLTMIIPTQHAAYASRLSKYYSDNDKTVSSQDIERVLKTFEDDQVPYDQMMKILVQKHGAEESELARVAVVGASGTDRDPLKDRAYYERRLAAYYASNNRHVSSQDIDKVIKTFEDDKVPYEQMMKILFQRHGSDVRNASEKRAMAERLLRYYKTRNPSQANPATIELVLKNFEVVGYDVMWKKLHEKYGPEDAPIKAPVRDRAYWAARLLRYYTLRNPSQASPEGMEFVLDKFEHMGYDAMWAMLVQTYGQEPPEADDPTPVPKEVRHTPNTSASPPGAFMNRRYVCRGEVRYLGLDLQRYETSHPKKKSGFREAIEQDMADTLGIERHLVRVTQVYGPRGGLSAGLEIELRQSHDWEMLSKRVRMAVQLRKYSLEMVSHAYERELKGDTLDLVVQDAVIVGSGAATPLHQTFHRGEIGMRGNVMPVMYRPMWRPPPVAVPKGPPAMHYDTRQMLHPVVSSVPRPWHTAVTTPAAPTEVVAVRRREGRGEVSAPGGIGGWAPPEQSVFGAGGRGLSEGDHLRSILDALDRT